MLDNGGNPAEPLLRFVGVHKRFGNVEVLRGLELDVHDGERVTLIGPSGSGKTTVLRLAMTLDAPTSGQIIFDGQPLRCNGSASLLSMRRQMKFRRAGDISMVFQQFNLFPHMTVLRNLMEGPRRALKQSREESEERAIELLRRVGLAGYEKRYPRQLSGGQQQRVAIARAMAMEPRVLLFDEITSSLDPELIGEVLAVVRDLATRTSMTMLFVTHEMNFARQVSDRIAMFDHGNIVEIGSPEQIFESPEQDRTRSFLKAIEH